MPKEITVNLLDPLVGHGALVTSLRLREPRAHELFELGELQIVQRTPSGEVVFLDRDGIYMRYAEKLLVHESTHALPLDALSMADGYQVKEAIAGFFQDAQRRAYAPSPSSSSSSSDGSAPPSS